MQVIWVKSEPKYFFEGGWTGESVICPTSAKSVCRPGGVTRMSGLKCGARPTIDSRISRSPSSGGALRRPVGSFGLRSLLLPRLTANRTCSRHVKIDPFDPKRTSTRFVQQTRVASSNFSPTLNDGSFSQLPLPIWPRPNSWVPIWSVGNQLCREDSDTQPLFAPALPVAQA
jgi:hypothetical protein